MSKIKIQCVVKQKIMYTKIKTIKNSIMCVTRWVCKRDYHETHLQFFRKLKHFSLKKIIVVKIIKKQILFFKLQKLYTHIKNKANTFLTIKLCW